MPCTVAGTHARAAPASVPEHFQPAPSFGAFAEMLQHRRRARFRAMAGDAQSLTGDTVSMASVNADRSLPLSFGP